MSKTGLKKELAGMDCAQLTELIVDLYESCKPARAYLDFFCDPQPQKLFDRYSLVVAKETARRRRGRCTARISRINAAIREFASFGVDDELQVEFVLYAVRQIILAEQNSYMPETMRAGCSRLIENALTLADRQGIFSHATSILDGLLDGSIGSPAFIRYLRHSIANPEK